jgi:hypothetical protein
MAITLSHVNYFLFLINCVVLYKERQRLQNFNRKVEAEKPLCISWFRIENRIKMNEKTGLLVFGLDLSSSEQVLVDTPRQDNN